MEVESNVAVNTGGGTEAAGTGGHKGKMEGNRRPMNAFLLFCKRHRAIVKEVYPNLENRHITKILGEFWGSLSQEEKLPFNDLAASYKDHLMREGQVAGGKRASQAKAAAVPVALNQTVEITEEKPGHEVKSGQGSSGSSSPEPGQTAASSAPKPFKKRYLALASEKAKSATTASSTTVASGESSERKSACEALLKLAEGSQVVTENNSQGSTTTTNGSVKSNPYDKVKESAQFTVLRQAVWTRVAKTILTQEEEKGKLSNKQDVDKPINLSSQCLIPNSTIIEHIIENIINDDNVVESAKSSSNSSDEVNKQSECSEQIKEKIYQSLKEDITRRSAVGGKAKDGSNDLTALWKMLPNPIGGNPTTTAKKNGIQAETGTSIKKAHSAPASQSGSGAPSPKGASGSSASGNGGSGAAAAEPAVSVTLVTSESDLPLNLSKTPPATPSSSLSTGIAITITTSSPAKRKLLDEDDDDLRRSSRACKGRRYQEFKDAVGHRRSAGGGGGRAASGTKVYMGKSDGESSQHSEDEMAPNSASSRPLAPQQSSPKSESKPVLTGPMAPAAAVSSAFDLEKALMNIPALRPEEFQRRIQMSRQRSSTSSSHPSAPLVRGAGPIDNTTAMDTTNSSSMTSSSLTADQVTNHSGRRTKSTASASRPPPPSSSESTLVVSAHGH